MIRLSVGGISDKQKIRGKTDISISRYPSCWVPDILITIILLSVLFILPCFALNNPEEKVREVIKDFILTKHPVWSRDEIQITFKSAEKAFEEMKKLGGDVSFKVIEIYPEFNPVGNVIFPIEVSGEAHQKFFLRAKVEVFKKVVAAARRIKRGKLIDAQDLKFEERDVALLPQKYFLDASSLEGKEAKISIPFNSTIFEWMVGDTPLIRRGSEVTIVASAAGVEVKTKGEALEDGYQGGEIKVKRKETKKTIVGKVISATEVEVKL